MKINLLSKLSGLLLFLCIIFVRPDVSGQTISLPPIANFAFDYGIDTAWVNSSYSFVNTSTNDSLSYWRIENFPNANSCVGNNCYHQTGTTRNFRYSISDTGTYLLTLITVNRLGMDSISKLIYVGYPSKKPVANFLFDKTTIGMSERIAVYDLSENGPTSWSWYLDPYCAGCATDITVEPNSFLPSASSQFPVFRALDIGVFDVCLRVANAIGADTICKKKFVEVTGGVSMCGSTIDTITRLPSAYLYDHAGPVGLYYSNNVTNCQYVIDPCATQITAYLEQFRLRNQDSILFIDGSPNGTIISRLGGKNITTAQRTIIAPSGKLYLKWKIGLPVDFSGDSGIIMRWTSTLANYSAPNAFFTCPDTVYSGQTVQYINGSKGNGLLSYNWDTNGDGIFFDYQKADGASRTFISEAPYLDAPICLKVSNCSGSSTYCKTIRILPQRTRPVADFTINQKFGFVSDTFKLTDYTKNGPTSWLWSVSPSTVTFPVGSSATAQNPKILFNLPGKYTVKLIVTNKTGIDSIIKTAIVDVISYSAPNSDFPIASASDIGITRVQLANIDTSTALKSPTYHALFPYKRAVLYRGVNYKLTVSRSSANSKMERKAWIDFNFDSDFIDSGENILKENYGINLEGSGTFKINNDVEPGRISRLRIGVSEGGTTLTPDMARSGCFEDYGIEIGNDFVSPSISLKGDAVYRVQKGKAFVDPGVSAIDNNEGEIGDRFESTSNVDTSIVGNYTVKYWVRDLYGNVSDTIMRVVQVEVNRVGPTVTLNGGDTVTVEVYTSYVEQGALAIDYTGKDITSRIIRSGYYDTARVNTYKLSYSVIDEFGFVGQKDRWIKVVKTSKPTVQSISSNGVYNHQIYTKYTTGDGLIITDKYFGLEQLSITRIGSVNENNPEPVNLIYTVCDPLGNCSDPYTLVVDVKDTIAPSIMLLGDNPLIVDVYNDKFNDPGIVASDNYFSSNALVKTTESKVNVKKLGDYSITYVVKDGFGNTTSMVRGVKVVDRIAPTIEILGGTTLDQLRFKDFIDPGVRIYDNYDSEASLRPKLVVSSNMAMRGDTLWADVDGWKYVRYQVTDSSNNTSVLVERVIRVSTVTGLDDILNSNGVAIYPNPNNGNFSLTMNNVKDSKYKINVYSAIGAKVFDNEVSFIGGKTSLDLSYLKAGVYLVQLQIDDKTYTQRVSIR